MVAESAYDGVPVDISSTDHDFESPTRSIYVGGAGDLIVELASGKRVTLTAAAAGYHPLAVKKVVKTGTAATSMVALF